MVQSENPPEGVAHFTLGELHDCPGKTPGMMGKNQQCQTKGTSSKTIRNELRMAVSQHITVPTFYKDTSRIFNS